jgi:hypothetical protein
MKANHQLIVANGGMAVSERGARGLEDDGAKDGEQPNEDTETIHGNTPALES